MEYLAIPYSHKDPKVMEQRFELANQIAAKFLTEGRFIYSPISHTHPIAKYTDKQVSWDFWKPLDIEFLKICSRLIVVCIPGWQESIGVQAEIKEGLKRGMVIEHYYP